MPVLAQRKLTPKQKKFVAEYVKTGNATESYKNAGYKVDSMSIETIGSEAHKTLKKPLVNAEIDKQMAKLESHKIMDAKEALEGLTSIARGEMTAKQLTDAGYLDVYPTVTERQHAFESILRRYPVSDIDRAQIKKAQAEAIRAEAEARVAKAQAEQLHTVADKTREKMDKLSVEELRNLAKLAGEDDD